MVKLIILDLYGTIIRSDVGDKILRPGFPEFLEHYKDAKKVVFTDACTQQAEYDLQRAELQTKFNRVYDDRYCVAEQAYRMKNGKFREALFKRGKGQIKNLKKVCEDFSADKSDSVFISDNFLGWDALAAQIHEIRFIRVPQFRLDPPSWREKELMQGRGVVYEDPSNPFSFTSLIGKL